jgi:hypothetical protein
MAYFNHNYNKFSVIYGIDYAIAALPDSVFVVSCQLLASVRTRICGYTLYFSNDADAIFFRKGFDFLYRGRLDVDLIICHASSDP